MWPEDAPLMVFDERGARSLSTSMAEQMSDQVSRRNDTSDIGGGAALSLE
jgi:hypothetical protein